ncbi:FUSC family protein [Kineosporia succinea]|uniref:Integral membrane bound transporter domain-containing protein n=1 Tax=Kineosporia succinea TaxID=84632 RepID=A0ABT9NWF7_9ACTN|nr:FUSC family protein [Kineosporia succinea]MDP9824757.1 hypothetical protein [Kineosporia succinea]
MSTLATVRGWGLTELRPHEHAHWAALRAVLSVGVPVSVVLALGRSDLTLFASFGAFNSLYGRHSIYASRLRMQTESGLFMAACVTLGVVVAAVGGTPLAIAATTAASGIAYLVARWAHWAPPGSLFAVFAVGACSSHPQDWSTVPLALAVSLGAASLAVLLGQSGQLFAAGRNREKASRKTRLSISELFRGEGVRGDLLACTAGPAIAGTVAAAAGGAHPYWAMVSAVAPLMSPPGARHRVTRALHRVWGTALGVLISLAVLSTDPGVVTTLVLALLAQAFAELFVMRNYGLAVIAITPLALLMQHLAVESDPLATTTERMTETALGAAIAVGLILLAGRPKHTSTA